MQKIIKIGRNWRITIPAEFRRKLGVKGGDLLEVRVVDGNVVFKLAPKIEDLAGADAGKTTVKKAFDKIDKMRSQERC